MTKDTNKSTLKMLSNPQQIHDNPVNNSTSKALFSFPHAERFKISNKNATLGVGFYDVKETNYKNNRVTSMGKGFKYDFTKNALNCPGPNAYFPTNLTISSQIKNGSSFGISREKITNTGLSQIINNAKKVPGPGAYEPKLPKTQQTISFHIKLNSKKDTGSNIGPGNYTINSTFEPSKSILNSKYKNVKGTKFGKAERKENTLPIEDGKILPAVFDNTYQINNKGSYFNSKYPNSKCRSFGKSIRDNKIKDEKNPGPGQYRMPSEFGIYESTRV